MANNNNDSVMTPKAYRAFATERFRALEKWKESVDEKLDKVIICAATHVSEPDCEKRREKVGEHHHGLAVKVAWAGGAMTVFLLIVGVLLRFTLAGG